MPKHRKTAKPSDQDLTCNPMIGGSKGAYRAGVRPKELAESEGVNTIELDVWNGVMTLPRYGKLPNPTALHVEWEGFGRTKLSAEAVAAVDK